MMLGWLKDKVETKDGVDAFPIADMLPQISFRCAPEDEGIIAQPVAAKHAMPDWFKRLPAVAREELSVTNNALTVKRCMPFLDALTFGWVIPLAATVRLDISDGGASINCGWDFDKEMISSHGVSQVAGHPRLPMPPMKFHNYWTIVTPPGWSCLFIPPLNRPNSLFEIASGVVDTDTYHSLIHFPFFATAGEGIHTIERGTPIVQVIPFRRDSSALEMIADIRAETSEEAGDRERIRRSTMASEGWYRQQARAPR
jgi:antitoxin (DNA-binding transcriptional repressor) of toxin-antitoxin stability system